MLQATQEAFLPLDEFTTTAIYPNRLADKKLLESQMGLQERGDETTAFWTNKGTLFATGYERIVYGDHGPYIEFRKDQVVCPLRPKFKSPLPPDAYYEWLLPLDGSAAKVYDQKRDVRGIKSAPKGGFAARRKEGYADYRVGKIYVAPFDLRLAPA